MLYFSNQEYVGLTELVTYSCDAQQLICCIRPFDVCRFGFLRVQQAYYNCKTSVGTLCMFSPQLSCYRS